LDKFIGYNSYFKNLYLFLRRYVSEYPVLSDISDIDFLSL